MAVTRPNSKRTFQIPASRSQNMPGRILRTADFLFLVTKSGAEATDFSAQISQFSFLSSNSGPGLEFGRPHISHFSILDANPRTPTARRCMRSWKHAYPSSGQTAGSILRTHIQVCSVPRVRSPTLLVELVEPHFTDGLAGDVRPAGLHQPRDLRRVNCLGDVVLLVRGHTCWQDRRRER